MQGSDAEFASIVRYSRVFQLLQSQGQISQILCQQVEKDLKEMREQDLNVIKLAVASQDGALLKSVSEALDARLNGPGEINFEFGVRTISHFWFNNEALSGIRTLSAKDLTHFTMLEVLERRKRGHCGKTGTKLSLFLGG